MFDYEDVAIEINNQIEIEKLSKNNLSVINIDFIKNIRAVRNLVFVFTELSRIGGSTKYACFFVYFYLLSLTNYERDKIFMCYPSFDKIQEDIGMSKNTITKCINILIEINSIEIKEIKSTNNKFFYYQYILLKK